MPTESQGGVRGRSPAKKGPRFAGPSRADSIGIEPTTYWAGKHRPNLRGDAGRLEHNDGIHPLGMRFPRRDLRQGRKYPAHVTFSLIRVMSSSSLASSHSASAETSLKPKRVPSGNVRSTSESVRGHSVREIGRRAAGEVLEGWAPGPAGRLLSVALLQQSLEARVVAETHSRPILLRYSANRASERRRSWYGSMLGSSTSHGARLSKAVSST